MKFIVSVPEVWIQEAEVEAESSDEALIKVMDGEGDYLPHPEYSHTLDTCQEDWKIKKILKQ